MNDFFWAFSYSQEGSHDAIWSAKVPIQIGK